MIKVLFDGEEYFHFTSLYATHTISRNLAFKHVYLKGVASKSFGDFIELLNKNGKVLVKVFIKNKLYNQGYVVAKDFSYEESSGGGIELNFTVRDRFQGIISSSIIRTKPVGTLKSFLANVCKELNYNGKEYLGDYLKTIKSPADFIEVQNGISNNSMKTFERSDLVHKKGEELIGEALSLSNLFLISNGIDTLTLEKPNSNLTPIFEIRKDANKNLISYAKKIGETDEEQTPETIIILNSGGLIGSDKKKIKDANTSVIVYNKNGSPNVQKVKNISVNASYQDLKKAINYNLAGLKARQNSFVYKIPGRIFDDYGEFVQPNKSVKVFHSTFGLDEIMSILSVSLEITGDSGANLTLNVCSHNSFENNSTLKQKKSLMR